MKNYTLTADQMVQLEDVKSEIQGIITVLFKTETDGVVFTKDQVIQIIEMAREGDMAFDSHYHEVETAVEVEVETKVNGGYAETSSHTIDAEVDLKAVFEDNMDKFKVTFDYDCAEAVLEAWEDKQERKKAAEMQSRPLTEEERAQLEANLEQTRQRLESNITAE